MEDKAYFDAKFEGLKDLMVTQNENMSRHISAVSGNVKAVERGLSDHKESESAHGLGGREKNNGAVIGWIGVIVGVAGIALAFRGH